jgi:type I restriction enzyme S subunit
MKESKEIQHFKLGDISSLSQGLAINSATKHLLKDDGIPLLRITDLINNKVEQYIDQENAPQNCIASKTDIIYTRTGQVGLVFNDRDGVIHNNCFKVTPDESIVDKSFLYWFLSQKKIRSYASNIASGSVQKDLNHSSFASIPIELPNLRHQQRSANILNSIREKIELNQKMSETIEEIAKTIFKSWFIDFDPVKEKLNGAPTGLSKKISDLFPDSFEDSELGKIPKGWNTSTIGKSLKVILGGTPSRKRDDYWNGTIPWINSGKLNNFRITSPSEFITQDGYNNSSTKMLSKRSTLIAITGATLGQISINEIDICANQSVIGIPPSEIVPSEFVYLWINSSIKKLISAQTGGAQQHINKNDVEEHLILIPSNKCNIMFQEIVKPIFDKISKNTFENKILIRLRDILLPKLISGELTITDKKKIIKGDIV